MNALIDQPTALGLPGMAACARDPARRAPATRSDHSDKATDRRRDCRAPGALHLVSDAHREVPPPQGRRHLRARRGRAHPDPDRTVLHSPVRRGGTRPPSGGRNRHRQDPCRHRARGRPDRQRQEGPLLRRGRSDRCPDRGSGRGNAGKIVRPLPALDRVIIDAPGCIPFPSSGGALLFHRISGSARRPASPSPPTWSSGNGSRSSATPG